MSGVTLSRPGPYVPTAARERQPADEKWSPGRTLRFVVFTSLGLWAVIIGTVVTLF